MNNKEESLYTLWWFLNGSLPECASERRRESVRLYVENWKLLNDFS